MIAIHKSVRSLGVGFAVVATSAGITALLMRVQPMLFGARLGAQPGAKRDCKTITTDPKPPLSVRSSPVVAPDNIVGKLGNGTRLTVVDENEGWLRIAQPIAGWVYKPLTVTSCVAELTATAPTTPSDPHLQALSEATEFYQAGNLDAAIARAKTIPPSSDQSAAAANAIARWQRDWQVATVRFDTAQKAFADRRWQDVILQAKGFPANRFWYAKLTPLVRQAIEQQAITAQH